MYLDIVGLVLGAVIFMTGAQLFGCSVDGSYISFLLGGLLGYIIGSDHFIAFDDENF